MKVNGEHRFQATSQQVFQAILDPAILRSCIPGCNLVEYLGPDMITINISTPLPGLKGPYGAVIQLAQVTEPNRLTLTLQRKGAGGSITARGEININDEADGALLVYDANATLEGPVAIANNPLGQGIVKNSLKSFFKNLDTAIKNGA